MDEDEECVQTFSNQFVNTFCRKLVAAQKQIDEFAKKQEPVISELADENRKLCDKDCQTELNDVQAVIKMYQNRLVMLKREMNSLVERSKSLRERTVKLKRKRPDRN